MSDAPRSGRWAAILPAAHTALLLIALLGALWLRVYRLAEVPVGIDYDEAGNFVLVGEIATGQSRPIFIRAYAGREAIFFWLAAASMRLLGQNVFALRLAAALCGVLTVLLTYVLAREIWSAAPPYERAWVPLLSAAILAVSYWQVHANRYGFRVNSMPPFLIAATCWIWRGLRRNNRLELVAAGLICGLSANTYLAVRAWPFFLLPFWLWIILTWHPAHADRETLRLWRWKRVRQMALFGLAALIAFAPLGIFFLQNPEYFSLRMGQASITDPEVNRGDLWGTLARVTVRALGVFTVHGDDDPIYNTPGKPIFGPLLGVFFYAGLILCLWRAIRAPTHRDRTPYLLILLWLPVMLVPNILGARGVPHALRSMGLIPIVYYVPALGLAAGLQGLDWAWKRLRRAPGPTRLSQGAGLLLALLLLAIGGLQTRHQYFDLWANSAGAYYNGSAALRRAADYLETWDPEQVDLWVSNSTYRHTTFAAACAHYARLHWFSGQTLVLPMERDRPVLYSFDFTNPLDPVLARYLPAEALQHRDLGPDGGVGFETYLLDPQQITPPTPQYPVAANLGNTIALLGYDLNAPAVSGEVLDVTFYWRVLHDGDRDDYTFFAHLVDDLGFRWGGETFFPYPSLQWRTGDLILQHKQIPIADGAPPDGYTLVVGVFSSSLDARLPLLNADGQMAGTTVEVGPVPVAAATRLPTGRPPMEQSLDVSFGPALILLGTDRDRGDLRPGETLDLTLYWQAAAPIAENAQVRLWLEQGGQQIDLWEGAPVRGRYPFTEWQTPGLIRDRYALRLPTDTAAGDWSLRLALLRHAGTPLPAGGRDELELYTLHVHETDRLWEPPAGGQPVEAMLGGQVVLLRYALDRTEARPGETVHLTLVWRCQQEMDTSYTVFTHLLDAGGLVRGQKDNPPMEGRYPTTLWLAGEVVIDEYDLAIQPDAPPGDYVIEVGMYDPATMQRLPVLDLGLTAGDRVLVGKLRVLPK